VQVAWRGFDEVSMALGMMMVVMMAKVMVVLAGNGEIQ
jgi:hypothetical protein